jgi:hypothetical protein
MDNRSWTALHAYYHGDLSAPLTAAVAPAMRALSAGGLLGRWFFVRYWEGGPHLRIRLLPREASRDAALAVVSTALESYLNAHPAGDRVGLEPYVVLAAELARREGRTDYERTLCPPDRVVAADYRPEHEVYGKGAWMDAVERHFCESSELAVRIIEQRPSLSRRRGLALSAGLLAWAVYEPRLGLLASAVQRAVTGAARPVTDALTTSLAAAYDSRCEELRATAERLWRMAGEAPVGTGGGFLTGWLATLRALDVRLRSSDGRSRPETIPPLAPLARLLIGNAESVSRAVRGGVLLRCAHLFNNRLGVNVDDEAHVEYFAMRTLSDLAPASSPRTARRTRPAGGVPGSDLDGTTR